jgi:hypothetical protein
VPAGEIDLNWVEKSLDQEGYVILRAFLEPEIPAGVRREVENWVDRQARRLYSQGLVQGLFEDEDFETRLLHLVAACPTVGAPLRREELYLPGTFSLFFHPRLLDIVEHILGEEIRLYPSYTVRPKLPFDGPACLWRGTSVWHQDASYLSKLKLPSAISFRTIGFWTSLVSARPENGCMQFIPGSHKLGIVAHEERDNYLTIAEDVIRSCRDRAVDIPTDPGDIVIFSNMLFHTGQLNRTSKIRWSCDWRYQDARQPTLRLRCGHLARSRTHPEAVIRTPEQWVNAAFF